MQRLREQADEPFALWLFTTDQPTLISSYMREYYESIDRQVRVTIDYDLVAYRQVMYTSPNLVVKTPIPNR